MSKPRAVGADAVNLIGFETIYGTPPAGPGAYYRLPMRQYGLSPERAPEDDPTWNRGTPDAGDPVEGPVVVNDAMTLPMCVRATGIALKAVLGAPDTAETGVGTGVYDHVYASGEPVPSFSAQTGHPELTTPKWRTVHGVKAGGLNFDMARTGRALIEIPLIGQGEIKDVGGARDAAPIAYDYLPFDNARGSIKVGGAGLANVTAARFSYSNSLEAIETIRADGMIDGVDEGERLLSGTVDVRFGADTTLEDLADVKTPAALELAFSLASQPTWGLKFQLPRVFFFNPKRPISGPGGISQSWQWRAAWDETLGYMLGVVLTNDVVSY